MFVVAFRPEAERLGGHQ